MAVANHGHSTSTIYKLTDVVHKKLSNFMHFFIGQYLHFSPVKDITLNVRDAEVAHWSCHMHDRDQPHE
jgi:hypothetical protein